MTGTIESSEEHQSIFEGTTIGDVVAGKRSMRSFPSRSSMDAFLRGRRTDEPLVIRSALEKEDMKSWTPNRLAEATRGFPWKTYCAPTAHMVKHVNTWAKSLTLRSFLEREDTCGAGGDDDEERHVWMYPRFPSRWIPSWDGTQVKRILKKLSLGGDANEPLVRIAKNGTVWGAHFDEDHNHLIQLFGRKRVVLVPYDASGPLRLQDHRHTAVHLLEDVRVRDVPAREIV